jgi:alpha-amylase/alpha-mannosidase (GH57 family)
MKTICLYFEIHQIIHLKRYRFFEIGTDHYYYDDYANEQGINEVAERSYIPALKTLIEMAKENEGMFKVALSISGVALEQLEIHAPAVIELLHELNATGCCEFICEPYSHGLSSLANEDCFREEVEQRSADGKRRGGQQHRLGVQAELAYLTNVEEVFPDDEAETSHGYQHRNGDEHQGVALISGEARERRGYPAQVESGVAERGDARENAHPHAVAAVLRNEPQAEQHGSGSLEYH